MHPSPALLLLLAACGAPDPVSDSGRASPVDPAQVSPGAGPTHGESCPPQMVVFPVEGPHNIGYDHSSCGTGTCEISCPDANANSDWGGDHHGIDVFAWHRAPLIAVAEGQVVRVGTPSDTSGLRVRLRDACGWEYYYGHMDEAVVDEGDWVGPGDLLGYMGATGTASTHLHFNVSWDGSYSDDIDPFDLLWETSDTVCDGTADVESDPEPEPEEESSSGGSSGGSSSGGSSGGSSGAWDCGAVEATTYFEPGDMLTSCSGQYTLVQQTDGNLVLYQVHAGAVWHAGTHGHDGAWAALQDDGNLVIYSSGGTALWSSGTQGNAGAWLAVQDDGNLVIYSSGGSALWWTGG